MSPLSEYAAPALLIPVAALSALLAALLAFAEYALLASVSEREPSRPPGEDYADRALVTRLMEDPRAVSLQLSALRNTFRWLSLGAAIALGVRQGIGASLLWALGAGLLLHVLEEELPMRIVLRDPGGWALRLLPPLSLIFRGARAASGLLELIDGACRALVRTTHRREAPMSVEELTMMAAAGGADLGIEERRMLRGIFRSSGILVADIMTPRDRVDALDLTTTVDGALDAFRRTRHSRIPVYDATLDRVVGMAHARDFLPLAFEDGERPRPIRDHLRDAYFVRQDRRIQELFEELREGRIHMAVVVDRLGRTRGIVSLDDILEEIVGELHDERQVMEG